MEELLIKVKDEKESSFLKGLLKKLKIQFETVNEDKVPTSEEIKQSVFRGQEAFRKGDFDQFVKIDRKDLWK